MEERYKATLILHALGDTIGFKNGQWEFNFGHESINANMALEILYDFISLGGINHLNTKDWIVSDDTVLHMATAKSLLHEHEDLSKLGNILSKEYIEAFNNMKDRYPGESTEKYVNKLKKGNSWDETPYDENSGGSGAAMRCSCVGLIYHGKENRNKLIKYALEISRITHNNATGYLGGITSALFTAFAIENIDIELWITKLLKILDSDIIDQYLKDTRGYKEYNKDKYAFISNWTQFKDDRFDENNKLITPKNMKNITARCNYFRMNIRDVDRQSGYIGSSGDDSVIMAYAALLDAKDNWEKLVIYSMLHMGDTDTTGCIAASWYGALYGFNDVSQHLIDNLEYIDDLEKLGSKFYSKFGSK